MSKAVLAQPTKVKTQSSILTASVHPTGCSPQSLLPLAVGGICLLVNLVALGLRNFDGLYGQDSFAYYAHSVELHQRFSLFHQWQWETQERILYWPIGYPLLVSLFFKISGATAGAAQLVSLLCWAGTSGLVAAITQRLWMTLTPNPSPRGRGELMTPQRRSQIAPLVAGGLVALSPLGRQAATTVMADAATLLWTVTAVWLALLAREAGRGWCLILAGSALGLACITRYFALTAIVPIILLTIYDLRFTIGRNFFRFKKDTPNFLKEQAGVENKPHLIVNRQLSIVNLLLAALALGLVCLPQIVINLIYPEPLWGNSWLSGWSPANWFQTEFATRDGFAAYSQSPLIFNLLGILISPRFLTVGVLPLIVLGAIVMVRNRRTEPPPTAFWVLLTWWLVPVAFLAGLPYQNERYALTFLPPLAIWAGIGAGWLFAKTGQVRQEWRKGATIGFLAIAIIGFIGLGWLSQRHLNGFIAIKDNDLAVVREAEKVLPANATLLTFGISLTFDRYTSRPVYDLWFVDPARLQTIRANSKETFMLVDANNMQQQWSGHFLGDNFKAAFARTNSQPIAQFGNYQLWRIS